MSVIRSVCLLKKKITLKKTFASQTYRSKVVGLCERIPNKFLDPTPNLTLIGQFKSNLALFSLNNSWISMKELKFNSDHKTKVP